MECRVDDDMSIVDFGKAGLDAAKTGQLDMKAFDGVKGTLLRCASLCSNATFKVRSFWLIYTAAGVIF